jgi:hypothetical protein
VYILGAGASWHYGYPTGEELVKKVIQKAGYLIHYFENSTLKASNTQVPDCVRDAGSGVTEERWAAVLKETQEIHARLKQVNPLVIDYFLGWNPRLQRIGKLLIAWVILECEYNYLQLHGNINRKELVSNSPIIPDRVALQDIDVQKYKDDWCRFILHTLAIGCQQSSDLLRNYVAFVTLNYDMSLEHALYHDLRHIELFKQTDIDAFFEHGRVSHIYGQVRTDIRAHPPRLKWSEQSRDVAASQSDVRMEHFGAYKAFLDPIYETSRNLRVIDPHDKETDRDVIETARKAIADASSIYILGYGFDEVNSTRLGLHGALYYDQSAIKSVHFTNFRDINRVNKRASQLFFRGTTHFFSWQSLSRADWRPYVREEHPGRLRGTRTRF